MSKFITGICAVVLLAVAGCGSTNDVTASRGLSATARETCLAVGYPDIAVDFLADLVRSDRAAGFTENEETTVILAACGSVEDSGCLGNPNSGSNFTIEQCMAACSVCSIAVLGEVYDEPLSARDICLAHGYSDAFVDINFTAYRADRDAGFTEFSELRQVAEGCRGFELGDGLGCDENPFLGPTFTYTDCLSNCYACTEAIVVEVYDE